MKVTGLDAFAKQMREMADFAKALERSPTEVTYDPHDEQSIVAAVRKMEA